MAGLIGHINQFDSDKESWSSYQERLEQYFLVNEITDEKQVPALRTLLGERPYGLLRNLTALDKPSTKTYDKLCNFLSGHLCPKPLLIAERFRFHERNQLVNENVQEYLAVLRKLTEFCDFGAALDDTIRDRFVCGLRDQRIQKNLWSEADLTLKRAVDKAVDMETVTKDAAELQLSTPSDVHKVSASSSPLKPHCKGIKSSPCTYCGKNNHESEKCKFKNATCHNCKIKGHIKPVCKKRNGNVNVTTQDDVEDDVLLVNSLNDKTKDKKIIIFPKIDDKVFEMVVDTGSAVSLIPHRKLKSIFGNVPLGPAASILKTYSGETIPQVGIRYVTVDYQGQKKSLILRFVKNDGPTLFGRDWLSHIKLNCESLFNVHSVTSDNLNSKLKSILSKYNNVLSDGIGKVKGMKASLKLKADSKPVFMKARTVPFSMKPKIEQELNSLEKQGIISRAETSDWATPIVPVAIKKWRHTYMR